MTRERVLQELRARLDAEEFRSGDRLPPERQLATELGVSRSLLRGALSILEAEGKIWRGVGQGTFVGRRAVGRPADLADIGHLTNPSEVMEVRITLEPVLAYLASQRATTRDLDEIRRCCEKTATAENHETYELWDSRFHRAIAEAARNQLFLALFDAMNSVRENTAWGRVREAATTAERQRHTSQQHREIVGALEDRDSGRTRAAMRQHLEAVRDNLLDPAPVGSGA